MSGTFGIVYNCIMKLVVCNLIFLIISVLSLIPVCFYKNYKNNQGWHTGALFLVVGLEIVTNFVVAFPTKDLLIYIKFYLFYLMVLLAGVLYYLHREKIKTIKNLMCFIIY